MREWPALIFFGASDFAVPTLRALRAEGYALRAVYTQPDRPAGRGRRVQATPVARAARELDLVLEQPARLRTPDVLDRLASYEPDAVVLASYGLLVPPQALAVPRLGWLNVHPSLLPRYRGASPVAAPILAGEEETGVSIFLMRAGLDDGPVLSQTRVPIGADETAGELTGRLALLGSDLLLDTLRHWTNEDLTQTEQEHALATYAPKLTREEARLDWSESAQVLARRVRAYNPWPVAYTYWKGERLRILRAHPDAAPGEGTGKAFTTSDTRLPTVQTGDGALVLDQVQVQGGRAIDGRAFLVGHADWAGSLVG
ncbi:MAG: methionyl-tRNA formyltransferase [Chloroflexota bacterium]|nr:methionyl-tRNA formyltransferase [Chloroflexota bacterium]